MENQDISVRTEDTTDVPAADAAAGPETADPAPGKQTSAARRFVRRYLIDAFSGMSLGLFCTLIVGTIVAQVGALIGDNVVGRIVSNVGAAAKTIMGAGIGAGIAYTLKAKKLTLFSAAAAGMIGANITNIFVMSGVPVWGASAGAAITVGNPGDPVAAYFASVIAVEISRLVEGRTPVDIILVPLCAIFSGLLSAICFGIPFGMLFALLGKGVAMAIRWEPISFGILISVVMGLLLTLPTSSAAFGVMLFGSTLITPELEHAAALAAGAACAGCCAHMVGFAVVSFRENRWGGLISQGLGTSMLQIPNLARNPRILIPAVCASAVAGPLSSAVFGLMCDSTGAGMGTSGLVGVIQTFFVSIENGMSGWMVTLGVLVCYFIVPVVIALPVSELMRKKGWLRFGDMKI